MAHELTECCFALFVVDSDFCTACGEHSGPAEPDNQWDAYGKAEWKERKLERRSAQ